MSIISRKQMGTVRFASWVTAAAQWSVRGRWDGRGQGSSQWKGRKVALSYFRRLQKQTTWRLWNNSKSEHVLSLQKYSVDIHKSLVWLQALADWLVSLSLQRMDNWKLTCSILPPSKGYISPYSSSRGSQLTNVHSQPVKISKVLGTSGQNFRTKRTRW